jgi:hypothetical protein
MDSDDWWGCGCLCIWIPLVFLGMGVSYAWFAEATGIH